ncbi:hypothetical protein BT69DRAFT_1280884 [Atractiella rhizophila]|nr:hypothetical protein BT69DRAFT_1280884 [Atractiella rhizophila]
MSSEVNGLGSAFGIGQLSGPVELERATDLVFAATVAPSHSNPASSVLLAASRLRANSLR